MTKTNNRQKGKQRKIKKNIQTNILSDKQRENTQLQINRQREINGKKEVTNGLQDYEQKDTNGLTGAMK